MSYAVSLLQKSQTPAKAPPVAVCTAPPADKKAKMEKFSLEAEVPSAPSKVQQQARISLSLLSVGWVSGFIELIETIHRKDVLLFSKDQIPLNEGCN